MNELITVFESWIETTLWVFLTNNQNVNCGIWYCISSCDLLLLRSDLDVSKIHVSMHSNIKYTVVYMQIIHLNITDNCKTFAFLFLFTSTSHRRCFMKTPSSVFSKRSLAIHPIFVHGQVCNLHAKGGSNPILPRYQKIWKMSTPARRRRVLCRRHPSNIDPRRIASNPAPQGVCGHQQWGS